MEMFPTPVHSALTLERFRIQMSLKFGISANQYPPTLICIKKFGDVLIWQKVAIPIPFTVMDMNLQRMQFRILQDQNHRLQVFHRLRVFRLPRDLSRNIARFSNWVFPSAVQSLPFPPMDINRHRMQILQAQEPKLELPMPAHNITSEGDDRQSFCIICDDYRERNASPIPFHCCVEDEITVGFRGPSPAGPIERPRKSHAQQSN